MPTWGSRRGNVTRRWPRRWQQLWLLAILGAGCLVGCAPAIGTPAVGKVSVPGGTPTTLPRFDHIVVVVEENHGYDEVMGSANVPYLASLAAQGAVFTDSHAVTHPSEPNYLALFAGSTFDISSDDCPQQLTGPNLASELIAAGGSFTGYSESMPNAGFTGCSSGGGDDPPYARKHNPWVNFDNVPAESNQTFEAFPTDFSTLPTVAFVVPNQQNDMHSGSMADANSWLRQHLDAYAQWAPAHNSLLIVTWDEDEGTDTNHILTLFAGAHVHAGQYGETINHYDVLRTIEALEGISFTHDAATATTIADVWQS